MKLAGRTPLGKKINKTESQAGIGKLNTSVSKFGLLSKSVGGKYSFMIKILGKDGSPILPEIGPIRLEGTPDYLAMVYGSPDDMVGLMVRVDYKGITTKRGTATIIQNRLNATPGQEYEDSQGANELAVKGCAFAPPGAGV
jgi:hypothetical protein